jgi:hypothetical protein
MAFRARLRRREACRGREARDCRATTAQVRLRTRRGAGLGAAQAKRLHERLSERRVVPSNSRALNGSSSSETWRFETRQDLPAPIGARGPLASIVLALRSDELISYSVFWLEGL